MPRVSRISFVHLLLRTSLVKFLVLARLVTRAALHSELLCLDNLAPVNNVPRSRTVVVAWGHLSIDRKILLPGSVGPSFSMEAVTRTESPHNQRRLLDHNYMLILSYVPSHFSIKAVTV